MKKFLIIITLLLTLVVVPAVLAKGGGHGDGGRPGGRGRSVEIKIEDETEDEGVPRVEIRQNQEAANVQNQRFEIRGTVDSISGNNIMVAGQTVVVDPAMVERFRQRGVPAVGSFVRVKGVIINSINFASEIRVN